MIAYDTQTTILTRHMHGISGALRTGSSVGLRNYITFLRMHSLKKWKRADTALWSVGDIISKRQTPLASNVPEVYAFTIGNGNLKREIAAIHGIVDIRRPSGVWEQQYRFVVVFKHEIEKTLRNEFKLKGDEARKFAQEVRLSA